MTDDGAKLMEQDAKLTDWDAKLTGNYACLTDDGAKLMGNYANLMDYNAKLTNLGEGLRKFSVLAVKFLTAKAQRRSEGLLRTKKIQNKHKHCTFCESPIFFFLEFA